MLQAHEHVVEAHFCTPALLHFKTCRYPTGRVLEQRGIRAIQGLQLLLQVLHGVEGWVLGRLSLPGLGHARRGQPGKTGAQVELYQLLIAGPSAELVEPGLEVTGLHLAAVDLLGG
ncbi:hypothetical protein D9M71_439110 [compost metagenome]